MSDGWVTVTDKRYRNKKFGGKRRTELNSVETSQIYENGDSLKRCKSDCCDLEPKDITKHFDRLEKITDDIIQKLKNTKIAKVYSWGSGSLEVSIKSRLQMAFAVLIAQKLDVDCLCYDPAYTDSDKKCINSIDKCKVTDGNNGCEVKFDEPSLVIGVHLFKKHYENLVNANLNDLGNLKLVGNDVIKMTENHTLDFEITGLKKIKDKVTNLFDVQSKWLSENNRSQDSDVFNDTVLTVFNKL